MRFIPRLFAKRKPEIESWQDFQSPEARALAEKYFVRISEIPSLYQALEATGGHLHFDLQELGHLQAPPQEIKEIIAGAIIHYEAAARPAFSIRVDEKSLDLEVVELHNKLFAVIERRVSVESHMGVAQSYV